MGEDEPRFNTTLLEMLRRDFGITSLDSLGKNLPHDEHGLDIDAIWRNVQYAFRDVRGWEVSRTIGLGLFSFAKYLMWTDLVEHGDILKESSVVSHLITPGDTFAGEPDFLPPDELDTRLPPREVFCPLLADSSQLAAVASASVGKNFVLEGPPGTGKSQTIANMIAHCLAHGKTVLFVAEKAAALNVVYQRLKNIGLGDFCLELHSNKAKKADVIAQLGHSASIRGTYAGEWDRKNAQLASLRATLNGYVQELHKTYPNGLTPYKAMGTIVGNPSCPEISLAWPSVREHDRDAYEALFSTARSTATLGSIGATLSQTSFRHIGAVDWSMNWQSRELLPALQRLRDCAEEQIKCARAAQELTGLPFANASGTAVQALRRLLPYLPELAKHPWEFVLRPDAGTFLPGFRQARDLLVQYDTMWKTLSIAYTPLAVCDDLAPLREAWMRAGLAWWPKSVFLKSKVANALKALAQGGGTPDCAKDLATLQGLYELRQKMEGYANLSQIAAGLFAGMESDRQQLADALDFAEALYSAIPVLAGNEEEKRAILEGLVTLADPSSALFGEESSGQAVLQAWDEATAGYESALSCAMSCLHAQEDFMLLPPQESIRVCAELENNSSQIRDWCAWLELCAKAREQRLAPLSLAVASGTIAPCDAEEVLRVNYARWWLCGVVDELPALRRFSLQVQERRISDFRDLDEEIRRMTVDSIAESLRSAPLGPHNQWLILQKEVTKKRRHLPVRILLEKIPDLLQQLTPCLLMSPLSIAQFLTAGKMKFDVVIFDEASQIPVWDAIGALARGDKAIIVGDTKQLPPTSFFQKGDDDADDDGLMGEDLESILEECIGSGMPQMTLRWHYRSRHESLISFSNHRYYNGNLVTFPAPDTHDNAVSFHYVEGGIYERGSSRTNPTEARAVVGDVVARLKEPAFVRSGRSIGIVTFNVQQQTLIEDLLDEARRADPSLEHFFGADVEEPVFVKNIENIQGDERDIMYFSICFAPDLAGKFSMNFGALNKDGGERRLNVAITRARYELRIFSSFYPNQIQSNSTKAQGVHDLRLFLEYAQQGISALAAEIKGSVGDYESPFEEAVAKELQAQGWEVHPQVGVSGFRVDLGIVDPDVPGEYLAGVEYDGYTYHRSATARDRDRLRESVLNGLGWALVRIWSTDWWYNREEATQKLDARLKNLLEEKRRLRREQAEKKQEEPLVVLETDERMGLVASQYPVHTVAQPIPVPEPASTSSQTQRTEDREEIGEAMQRAHLLEIIRGIMEKYAPIHAEDLCTFAAKEMGYSRAGSTIRQQVLAVAEDHFKRTTEDVGMFFWKDGQTPENCKFRKRGAKEACNVNHIAMPELAALARSIRSSETDPIVAMARKLGLRRLHANTRPRLEDAWRQRNTGRVR